MLACILCSLFCTHPAGAEMDAIDRIVKSRERDLALQALAVNAWRVGRKDLSRNALSMIQVEGQWRDGLLTIAADRNPEEGAELYALLCGRMAGWEFESEESARRSYQNALFHGRFLNSLPMPARPSEISSDVEVITVDADPALMAGLLEPYAGAMTREAFIVPFLDQVYRRKGSERLQQLSVKLEIDDTVRQELIAMALTTSISSTWTEQNTLDPDHVVTDEAVSTVLKSLDSMLTQKYSATAIETRDLRTEALIQQAVSPAEYRWWLVEAAYIETTRGFSDLGSRYVEEADSRGAFSIRDIGAHTLTSHTDQVFCAIALCIEQARLGDPVGAVGRLRNLNLPDTVMVESVLEMATVIGRDSVELQTIANELGDTDPLSAACLLIGRLGNKPTIPRSRWTNTAWAHSLVTHANQNWELGQHGHEFESRTASQRAAISLPPDCQNRLLLRFLNEERIADALSILHRVDIIRQFPSTTLFRCMNSESREVTLAVSRAIAQAESDLDQQLSTTAKSRLVELATENNGNVRYAALATLVAFHEKSAAPVFIPPADNDDAETEFLIYLLSGSSAFESVPFEAALESDNSWLRIKAARELGRAAVSYEAASALARKNLIRQRNNILEKILSAALADKSESENE
ncbi:MAG: hypothetical protein KDA91_24990 [Planctomycetaceae bacterium]|nr:hypothetical protein [Planctomycetaceae bacterium]